MPIFTYSKYISMIPEDTRAFVKKLLAALYYTERIELNRFNIIGSNDKLLFKALKAYQKSSETNKNILKVLGFENDTYISYADLGDETRSNLFTEYYETFTPFDSEEEYLAITPEDIIANIYNRVLKREKEYRTYNIINNNPEDFFAEIGKIGEQKRIKMVAEYNKKFNEPFSISVINYFDMVGKMFIYLRNHRDEIKVPLQTDNELKTLAMVMAVFYYNHVSVYQDEYNEQQIIVDYLTSKGLTSEKLEEQLGLIVDEKELETIDSTLVLTKFFAEFKIPNVEHKQYTVGSIYTQLINRGFNDDVTIKKILGLCNVTINGVNGFADELKKQKENLNDKSIEELYQNLMPNVISYIKRLARIYTYLLENRQTMDRNLVSTYADFYVLSVLLSSYEFKNDLNDFFVGNGLTIDKVLELAKLPTLEEYKKGLEQVELDEKGFARFSEYITKGVNVQKSKEAITVSSILDNTQNKDFTKSSLLQKMYKTATTKKLDNNFESQKNKFLDKKEQQRKSELTEEVLNNVPISIFNFLKVLCGYYTIFKGLNVPSPDLEQLSIIFAASRFDKRIEKYLNSFKMDRTSMANAFGLKFSYSDKPFDIEIITKRFSEYIFDRPNEEITVNSIFENAFNPELTNTLNLRRGLDHFGRTPEDFLEIGKKLDQFDEAAKKRERLAKQRELFDKCDEETRKIMEDVLTLHEYIESNNSNNITNPADIEELSILIALFINDEEYIPFFVHNGITLDEILAFAGLDKKIVEEIKKMNTNRDLIFEYEKYLTGNNVTLKQIIAALFNDKINDSRVLEQITEKTGNNFSVLEEEVKKRKEKDLTPEQGIQVLTAEEVSEISNPSFSSIATYGTTISKHSKYINAALHAMTFADTLEHSVEEINTLLDEVLYEEKEVVPVKTGFFSRFFASPEKVQVIKKVNPEKIGEIQGQVDVQILTLTKELQGYEFIKKYIEIYLAKLQEHLDNLQSYYDTMDLEEPDDSLDEITRFTRSLDRTSSKEIILDKINTFKTMILLMKQELISVHRAIINHFITINSLQTSKSAILPLLAMESALSIGKETEGQALELTGDLVDLFQNVVNQNIEATQANLQKLRLSSISDETYDKLNKNISLYLEAVDRSNTSLRLTEPQQPIMEEKKEEGPTIQL